MNRRITPLAAPATLALLLWSCAEGASRSPDGSVQAPPAPPGELRVSVRSGAIVAPDSVAPGWTRLRVTEDDGGHIVVLYRLTGDAWSTEPSAFAAALDGAATPAGAVALGGPEVGDSGEVIVELTPGRYALGCVRRGEDGHRHAAAGEARLLVVRDAAPVGSAVTPTALAAPRPTQEVAMADFAYAGPDRWTAGRHVLAVRNDGAQDHQLRLARLHPGVTLRDWMEAEDPRQVAIDVAGVARLGTGRTAYLPVELPPGEYVAYCLVPDARSGEPHVMLGMFRAIHVVASEIAVSSLPKHP